ncbi:MAG: hypothetical protein H6748_09535 [Spirochaetaceae bacterium]|nr:hypothetical protein [Myxococcales bacterium]MCB9724275.1 hypothetical protein [Spirochaetaceae bacterium]
MRMMRSMSVGAAIGLMVLVVSWPDPSTARDRRPDPRSGSAAQGLEVVTGTYFCQGTVYTDEQQADVSIGIYLGATSDLVASFFAPSRRVRDIPADLGAMRDICLARIESARSVFPELCALSELEDEGGDFGNGSSINVSFQFSCLGSRDEVVGVLGAIGREIVTAEIPGAR